MAIDGKGRPTKAQADERKRLQSWLDSISTYEREFKAWEGRVEKILKRYRDERRENAKDSRFNILWANVQTLIPATFSRLPQPDVSRRFRDNDPVGRVAALLLERSLDFEVQHYPDYQATLQQAVADRFLGGRGTAWARYEPHNLAQKQNAPVNGEQVTEDVDEPDEQLDYECAKVDYVHWKDFGHSVARTWEEVTKVWRKVYMTRDACVARFGEDVGGKIPLDSTPDEKQKDAAVDRADYQRALVYEGWDKERKEAVWFNKSISDRFLDTLPDPLNLEEFFPCPKPLYATLTNESLVPVPDFSLYQDQARELDTLSDRIDGLVKALQVKGTYDASVPELARIFTEASNTQLIPVKNWAAFVEKNGLQGAISLIDLKPIADALKTAYEAFFQIKAKIDELTGLADIIRGITDPNETLGAQELKGQYASLRLKDYQKQVAMFATAALRLKAQIICGKFEAQTIVKMASAEQLSPEDQQYVPKALELLMGPRAANPEAEDVGPNPLRNFRIEIAADTLVELDEQQEKKNAVEFVGAIGSFFKETGDIAGRAPEMIPFLGELLKFAVARFKVGKTIEGIIDQAVEQAKKAATQPKPPSPEQQAAMADAQEKQGRLQLDQQKQTFEEKKHADEVMLRLREIDKPEAVTAPDPVNPERENAEVAAVYADIDLKVAQADKTRAEAKVVPQKAAQDAMTADISADKTAAETTAITDPVEADRQLRGGISEQLAEVKKAVEDLHKAKQEAAGKAVVKVERIRGPEGNLIGVRHHHADNTTSEVAVH